MIFQTGSVTFTTNKSWNCLGHGGWSESYKFKSGMLESRLLVGEVMLRVVLVVSSVIVV